MMCGVLLEVCMHACMHAGHDQGGMPHIGAGTTFAHKTLPTDELDAMVSRCASTRPPACGTAHLVRTHTFASSFETTCKSKSGYDAIGTAFQAVWEGSGSGGAAQEQLESWTSW